MAVSSDKQRAFEGKVVGRVQGVGYRYFAMEQAREIGVFGWVRNLPDGSVGFHVEGPTVAVDDMLERLRQGPMSGHVERLMGAWLPKSEGHLGFEIRG
jgi:acylphosphatase